MCTCEPYICNSSIVISKFAHIYIIYIIQSLKKHTNAPVSSCAIFLTEGRVQLPVQVV